MTNQEAFDKVADHLLTQNSASQNKGGSCVYRAPDGKKCAIGCLIPDEEYKPYFEGRPVRNLRRMYSPSCLDGLNEDLLFYLQWVHDQKEPSEWRESLKQTAKMFGLEFRPSSEVAND